MDSIFIVIGTICTTLLTAYLTWYVRTKGQNQASKEDLKELTTIVEDVKKKSTEEIELLKANLSLLSNKRASLFNDEKTTIVDFFAKVNAWLWDILAVRLSEYNHTNFADLSERINTMRNNYYETNIAFAKMRILVKDDGIVNLGHKAIIKALEFHNSKEKYSLSLVSDLKQEKIYVDEFLKDSKKASENQFLMDSVKTVTESRKQTVKEDFAFQNAEWKDTIGVSLEFNTSAKIYLNS